MTRNELLFYSKNVQRRNKCMFRESIKTQKYPSLLEKGRDKANKKTVFRDVLNNIFVIDSLTCGETLYRLNTIALNTSTMSFKNRMLARANEKRIALKRVKQLAFHLLICKRDMIPKNMVRISNCSQFK